MKAKSKYIYFFIFALIFLSSFFTAFAHEVYVLDQSEVNLGLNAPQPDFINTIIDHLGQFIMWGLLIIFIILSVFFISISSPLERLLDPWLNHLKKYAPYIAQTTLGLALIASGYYHAIFGIELPLGPIFGATENFVAVILILLGAMLTLGILPRVAAIISTLFFIGLAIKFNIYMLNYFTYLGESLTITVFGGAHTLFANKKTLVFFTQIITPSLHKYKFLIMRIFFGISLIYASLYAKLIHGTLALEVVSKYNLVNYFPFDPVFLVLGAMLIEILLGLFFIFGFEIRFASLLLLVFLTMSLIFFGESVWPHIILVGTALAMFTHGYDSYTFSFRLKRKDNLEPVL